MAEVKNSFIKSKMNKDLDARLLPNGEYREGTNIQVSKSEGADVGALENVLGNKELVDFRTLTQCNCNLDAIGMYTNEVTNDIYVFLTDYDETTTVNYNIQTANYSSTANNYIYVYNRASNTSTLLVSGAFLNFSKNKPILNVNLLEDVLFWTDNRNQPRKINITSAINQATETTSNGFYTSEDQISVATYAPFQPIQLYYKKTQAYNTNGGQGTTSTISAGTTPTWTVDLDLTSLVGKSPANLIGATVSWDTQPVGTYVIASYVAPKLTITGTPDPSLTIGKVLTFNANTLTGNNQWVTTMQDVSSTTFPDGTANWNYNPNYNGDPDFLEDKFVRFSYRFKYNDGEYSIMAPFTQPTFIPKQDGYFLGSTTPAGNTTDENAAYRSTVVDFMENKVNNIQLQIPTPLDNSNNGILGNELYNQLKIDEIEILYKESDALAIKVVDTIPHEGENGYQALSKVNGAYTDIISYDYQSTKPFKTLPNNEITRVYDKVPVKAHGQEISGNRVIYSNFQNKHTPPEFINYNVAASEKYTDFIVSETGNEILGPLEITSSREYPMHTLKQNRNYQVGIILSDKYGRSSSTILSSASTQLSTEADATNPTALTLLGDTIYFPYNDVSVTNNINSWPGDSLKVAFNSAITSGNTNGDNNYGVNLSTLEPGIYNGDPTSENYNPLGWYSYKIVVKQQEQEYYNVYLPGILNGYPGAPASPPDPANTTAFITLINDNINKVPRDLTEVGPEQKQFRSSVQLYGRVTPDTAAPPTYNLQFNPGTISDTVNTIGDENDILGTTGTSYSTIYQTESNPLLARIAQGSSANPIGGGTVAAADPYNILLGIYETSPVESLLDIYWETSSTGTLSELNQAIELGGTGIKGFSSTTTAPTSTWTFALYENILAGQSPNYEFAGTYSSNLNPATNTSFKPFYPYVLEANSQRSVVTNTSIAGAVAPGVNPPTTQEGFWVTNANGDTIENLFALFKIDGIGVPDSYYIQIRNNASFYYGPDSITQDSYTFNFDVENLDQFLADGVTANPQYLEISRITLSEQLLNIKPVIDGGVCPATITVAANSSTIKQFSGVNGTSDTLRDTNDLLWSITQTPEPDINAGIPEILIDQTGLVTVNEETGFLNSAVTISVRLSDSGTNTTTYAAPPAYAECTTIINGTSGYQTVSLNKELGAIKNMNINQGPESSGFYWAKVSSTSANPVTSGQLPPVNRTPVPNLTNDTLTTSGVSSVTTPALTSGCTDWSWVNTNRNANVTFAANNSGLTGERNFDQALTQPLNNSTNNPADQTGLSAGSAYIIVDFEFTNYGSAPNDQPSIIWPAYLQYRETDSSGNPTSDWGTAYDVEGNAIKFGGTQANTYGVTIDNESNLKAAGVKDNRTQSITSPTDFPGVTQDNAFESYMQGRIGPNSVYIDTIGRILVVVGRNQAYREANGDAPLSAPDRFGDYRLVVRYPYGNNISVPSSGTDDPIIPVLTPDGCPVNFTSTNPYVPEQLSKEHQRVFLSYGDFYNPTQLVNTFAAVDGLANTQVTSNSVPSFFEYRVSTSHTTRDSAEAAFPQTVVYAKEWAFKYVTQFYTDSTLETPWTPGPTTTEYYAYRGGSSSSAQNSLNVKFGNDYANSEREGSPVFIDPVTGAQIGTNWNNTQRKWTAQFDRYGKKIMGTALPCVADLSSNPTPTPPPSGGVQFGAMVVNWMNSSTVKIDFSSNNFNGATQLMNALVNPPASKTEGTTWTINAASGTILKLYSGTDPYDGPLASIGLSGTSQAMRQTVFGQIEVTLSNVDAGSISWNPLGSQNFWWTGT